MTDMHPFQMDDFDIDDDDEREADTPDWRNLTYEVFNPDHSVGVGCDRDGEIIGLYITDDARDNGDDWLASQIVKLARLAHAKSRVGLRAEMEYKGTRSTRSTRSTFRPRRRTAPWRRPSSGAIPERRPP